MNISRWVDQLRSLYPRARLTMYDSRASYVNCAVEFEINTDPGSMDCYNTRFSLDRRCLETAFATAEPYADQVFEQALLGLVKHQIRSVR